MPRLVAGLFEKPTRWEDALFDATLVAEDAHAIVVDDQYVAVVKHQRIGITDAKYAGGAMVAFGVRGLVVAVVFPLFDHLVTIDL